MGSSTEACPNHLLDIQSHLTSLVAQTVKHLPTVWETRVRFLGREDPLEREMATHSSTLAWKIPWMEEPGRLRSMWLLRVGHDWATSLLLFTLTQWRRKWQPTPVFLPGESHGWRSLVGYSPWGRKDSDTTHCLKFTSSESFSHQWEQKQLSSAGPPQLGTDISCSLHTWRPRKTKWLGLIEVRKVCFVIACNV